MSRGNIEHSLTLAMPCLPSPLRFSLLSPAPARLRRAQPTPRPAPHRWGLFPRTQPLTNIPNQPLYQPTNPLFQPLSTLSTNPQPTLYIPPQTPQKSMVSLNKVFGSLRAIYITCIVLVSFFSLFLFLTNYPSKGNNPTYKEYARSRAWAYTSGGETIFAVKICLSHFFFVPLHSQMEAAQIIERIEAQRNEEQRQVLMRFLRHFRQMAFLRLLINIAR